MKIFKTTKEYSTWFKTKPDGKIGFVPTMGNLHLGHLSLLERSMKDCEFNIISIFVNPTQFAPDEDFQNYPRSFEEDVDKIKDLEKKFKKEIFIFYPFEKEVYPSEYEQSIKPSDIASGLEGKLRPNHFLGVVNVVHRLFSIIKPQVAYFGKKDYQQLKVIETMVQEYNLDIRIQGLKIIREESGLAMSSRNQYLSCAEKIQALTLYQSLVQIKETLTKTKDLEFVINELEKYKKDSNFNYLELKNADTLKDVKSLNEKMIVLGNYKVNKTKILDNIEINL